MGQRPVPKRPHALPSSRRSPANPTLLAASLASQQSTSIQNPDFGVDKIRNPLEILRNLRLCIPPSGSQKHQRWLGTASACPAKATGASSKSLCTLHSGTRTRSLDLVSACTIQSSSFAVRRTAFEICGHMEKRRALANGTLRTLRITTHRRAQACVTLLFLDVCVIASDETCFRCWSQSCSASDNNYSVSDGHSCTPQSCLAMKSHLHVFCRMFPKGSPPIPKHSCSNQGGVQKLPVQEDDGSLLPQQDVQDVLACVNSGFADASEPRKTPSTILRH